MFSCIFDLFYPRPLKPTFDLFLTFYIFWGSFGPLARPQDHNLGGTTLFGKKWRFCNAGRPSKARVIQGHSPTSTSVGVHSLGSSLRAPFQRASSKILALIRNRVLRRFSNSKRFLEGSWKAPVRVFSKGKVLRRVLRRERPIEGA